MAFERDYKSFPEYETCAFQEENRNPFLTGQSASYLNYVRNMGTMTPSRKPPQMGLSASHHRRTHSNVSAASSNHSSLGSSHVESDGLQSFDYHYNRLQQMTSRLVSQATPKPAASRMRAYENVPFTQRYNEQSTYNFVQSDAGKADYQPTYDRPDSLPFDLGTSPFRASLRKYSNASPRSSITGAVATAHMAPMQAPLKSSPTKTTPSDSLTSDDSSYLSAREGSLSSQSRVRFSPDGVLEQSPNGLKFNGQIRRLSRSQRQSITDMMAPTTSTPH